MEPTVQALPAMAPPVPPAPPAVRCETPRLSVVVVNYHQWPDTDGLIRQLRTSACLDNGAAEVVVVDNHAARHPIAAQLRRAPGVSLRRWRRNHGFARAVNEGCRLSRGDWLLLLNPDVTLDAGFADAALALAERRAAEQPPVGVVGFRLRDPGGGPQRSTGPFPTFAGTLLGLLRPRRRRKYDAGPPDVTRPVDWATGCCLLIRRACWLQLGGLDPDYFLYYEDVDFCRRARAAGWAVAYEPSPSAIHHSPLHARAVPPHIRLVTRHALLTYARKHWPAWQATALAGVVRLEAWARCVAARLSGDADAATVFGELAGLAADLGRGRTREAWRRLRRVVRRQEGGMISQPSPAAEQPPQP
jgi:GT2 family glycosyltransferase